VADQQFEDPTKQAWDLVKATFKLCWPKEVLGAATTEERRRKLRIISEQKRSTPALA
jgi:hypothetical protein